VSLEVNVPGVLSGGDVLHCLRTRGIPDIHDAESLREHVADIREATVYHELDAVRTAALIAMPDKPHIACQFGDWKILTSHVMY
jgi:hypothetical protein